MIDTIGSGIRKMFMIQKSRFFPLPEYPLEQNRVQVTITGRVLKISYACKLAELPHLALDDIILLSRVQKQKSRSDAQVRQFKAQGLIEGRNLISIYPPKLRGIAMTRRSTPSIVASMMSITSA